MIQFVLLNRNGSFILGVNDDGTIIGIDRVKLIN